MSDEARRILSCVAELPDGRVDLARSALAVALAEYPHLDIDGYVRRIDGIADEVRRKDQDTPLDRLQKLKRLLFDEMGFQGNERAYYDPKNSFLNEVLDRRLGIPITLSVLTIEVGRRTGLKIYGVGLPGHFVVGVDLPSGAIYMDPFSHGSFLTEKDCLEKLKAMFGTRVPFKPEFLKPQRKKEILTRMLRNLKNIYVQNKDFERALKMIDLILCLNPDLLDERRDRGLVYYQLECFKAALDDLETYLAGSADPDKEIRRLVSSIEKTATLLH